MTDLIRETIQSGHIVIWEEVARDGAQAKTLMTAEQRIKIARAQGKIFGKNGPRHLIFAAGYPSICKEEFEIICQLAAEVDNCSLATHGRAIQKDVDLGIQAMKNARYGRVSFAMPTSAKHSQIMMHQSHTETLNQSIELTRYALDQSNGLPIDIAFGNANDADPIFLAEAAQALTEEGAATIKICDSIGEYFPKESRLLFRQVLERVSSEVALGAHLHNDMGLALASNLEAVHLGIRMVSTSWLGLAERNGLAPTEQFLFALTHRYQELDSRSDICPDLWYSLPDLKLIIPIAVEVSNMLGIPLKQTDPIVSPNINQVYTGAYFNAPDAFKPFDAKTVLGIEQKLVLTHLANHSIVDTFARQKGYALDREQISKAMHWVKSWAYRHGRSEVPESEFEAFLAGLTSISQ